MNAALSSHLSVVEGRVSPPDQYYDRTDDYARGLHDGYQHTVNGFLYSREYRRGVTDGCERRGWNWHYDICDHLEGDGNDIQS